jgi:hypothetical protein
MEGYNRCIAIKRDGSQCVHVAGQESNRCKTHQNTLVKHGPNNTALMEIQYKQQKEIQEIRNKYEGQNVDVNQDYGREQTDAMIRHRNEIRQMVERQLDEMARTGVNPDREANERREAERIERNRRNRERRRRQMEEFENGGLDIEVLEGLNNALQRRNDELARIVRDNQGVHTTAAVNMVNKTIEKILKISVPEDYRWNMNTCSKTPGDIIVKCKLTPRGAIQMSSQYCSDGTIYGMERGIYGKVLDCVWQFILSSEDSDNLMKILKQEMEDNVGTCTQGNLTRLCNILGGYLDGIEVKESFAVILGNKMPEIATLEDGKERIEATYKLLVETSTPQSEWMKWIKPIMNYEDDDHWYRVEILNNSSTGTLEITEIDYEVNYED